MGRELAIIEAMLNTHRPTTVSEHMLKILNPLYRKTLVVLEKGIAGIYLFLLYTSFDKHRCSSPTDSASIL